MAKIKKTMRHQLLLKNMQTSPFLTDEELAKMLDVSIQTIRLDRLELGIPELRERTKKMAESAQAKIKSIASDEIIGDLIDLQLGKSAISIIKIIKS